MADIIIDQLSRRNRLHVPLGIVKTKSKLVMIPENRCQRKWLTQPANPNPTHQSAWVWVDTIEPTWVWVILCVHVISRILCSLNEIIPPTENSIDYTP